MKKITLIGVIIIILSAGIVFAQMGSGRMMGNRGQDMRMNRNWMNMPMMSGMMGGMMGGNIAVTGDGDVIVMSYNRLYKFDRDLKLVKQADIPFDKEHIQDMMRNIQDMGMTWGNMMWGNQGNGSQGSGNMNPQK